MRLTLVSDLHGNRPEILETEVLVIAGDICPDGNLKQQRWWLGHDCRQWLMKQPAEFILATWGNHDFVGQEGQDPKDLPWILLKDRGVTVTALREDGQPRESLKFHGMPWCSTINGRWAFEASEELMAEKLRLVDPQVDVLIIHGPPKGAGDKVITGEEVGSRVLRGWIFDHQPKLVVCGHIHEAAGVYKIGKTEVVNVSYVDERYRVARDPVVWTVEP